MPPVTNLHLGFGILMKIANTVYEQCIQTVLEHEMILVHLTLWRTSIVEMVAVRCLLQVETHIR